MTHQPLCRALFSQDEYQDTNLQQLQIIKMLCTPAVPQQQQQQQPVPLLQQPALPPPPPQQPMPPAAKDASRRETLFDIGKVHSRLPMPPVPPQVPPPMPPRVPPQLGMGVTVVGDDDQSIYSFRGAQPGVFRAFHSHMQGCGTVTLTQNFRSTAAIVTASTAIIKPNKGQRGDGPA